MPKKKVLIDIDSDVWSAFKMVALKTKYTTSKAVEKVLREECRLHGIKIN